MNVELESRESASINTKTSASFDLRSKKDYLTNAGWHYKSLKVISLYFLFPKYFSFDPLFIGTDIRNIEPLLRAFEETKKEKDDLLTNYKRTFDEFSVRCKEIASENSSLRRQRQEYKEKVILRL